MDLSVLLNSKFAVAFAIAAPFAAPLMVVAFKEPKSACEVLNNLVNTLKEKFPALKGEN